MKMTYLPRKCASARKVKATMFKEIYFVIFHVSSYGGNKRLIFVSVFSRNNFTNAATVEVLATLSPFSSTKFSSLSADLLWYKLMGELAQSCIDVLAWTERDEEKPRRLFRHIGSWFGESTCWGQHKWTLIQPKYSTMLCSRALLAHYTFLKSFRRDSRRNSASWSMEILKQFTILW